MSEKRISFIANGSKKNLSQLLLEITQLLGEQYQIDFLLTTSKGHAIELAREACPKSDIIVAVGGDGTLNEVANGIMQASEADRKRIFLGLWPQGTGNDFARGFQMPKDSQRRADIIKNEKFMDVDIIHAEFINKENNPAQRYFINISDVGIGADTVKIVENSSKWLGGQLNYTKGVVEALVKNKPKPVQVNCPEFTWKGEVMTVVIANSQYFGSGMGIAPKAILNDGLLDIIIISKISVLTFLRYVPKLKRKEIINIPAINYYQSKSCDISSLDKPCPIEMDGEFIGYTPFKTKIIKSQIKFLIQ